MSITSQHVPYARVETKRVGAANGVSYAYRDVGDGQDVPLVTLQHFRGNLDNWDPALIDALAADRRVITFDNAGVAASTVTTPHTVRQMALDALAFIDALGLTTCDLLGFSIGSFVAQEITLIRPDSVRRLVLAAAAPRGARGMHGWDPSVIGAVGKPEPGPEDYLSVFVTGSAAGQQAGGELLQRIYGARTEDRDELPDWATRLAQYDAVCEWGIPDASALDRLSAISQPVLVANGDSDAMILPRYSHLLAALLPDAQLIIYPDAAHGFLFQHHQQFAADVSAFLSH